MDARVLQKYAKDGVSDAPSPGFWLLVLPEECIGVI